MTHRGPFQPLLFCDSVKHSSGRCRYLGYHQLSWLPSLAKPQRKKRIVGSNKHKPQRTTLLISGHSTARTACADAHYRQPINKKSLGSKTMIKRFSWTSQRQPSSRSRRQSPAEAQRKLSSSWRPATLWVRPAGTSELVWFLPAHGLAQQLLRWRSNPGQIRTGLDTGLTTTSHRPRPVSDSARAVWVHARPSLSPQTRSALATSCSGDASSAAAAAHGRRSPHPLGPWPRAERWAPLQSPAAAAPSDRLGR